MTEQNNQNKEDEFEYDDEIEYVMDDIYEELVTKRDKGRRIRVQEYMGNIEVKVGGHERFIFEGIAKDKYPEVDEKKGKTSMIKLSIDRAMHA